MNKFNQQLKRDRIKRAKRIKQRYDSGVSVREIAAQEKISEKRVYALMSSLQ